MANEYLSTRCRLILDYLLYSKEYVSIDEIAGAMGISRRSAYYDMDKLNQWLKENAIPDIEITRGRGMHLDVRHRALISYAISDEKALGSYTFSPSERMCIISCKILSGTRNIQIDDLCSCCDVSRNTVLGDLKNISEEMGRYQLRIAYDSRKGYICSGDEIVKRTVFLYCFHRIYQLYSKGIVSCFYDMETYSRNYKYISLVTAELGEHYPDELISALAFLMKDMMNNTLPLNFVGINFNSLGRTKQYEAVIKLIPDIPLQEALYIALHLLGRKASGFVESYPEKLDSLAEKIVGRFEELSAIAVNNKEGLTRCILGQLNLSWLRYYYGITSEGLSVLAEIVKCNPNIYELTKDSCEIIGQFFHLPIDDREIASMAMYFTSYILQSDSYRNKMRILVVCMNGISTGNVLKWEITRLLPAARVIGVEARAVDRELKYICDLVVSTIPLKSDVPVEVVNARLTDEDKLRLVSRARSFMGDRKSPCQLTFDSIMSIIGRHVDKEKLGEIEKDILRELKPVECCSVASQHNGGGLLTYLSLSRIMMVESAMGWREALHYTSRKLVEDNSIRIDYIEEICSQLERLGPYMFLMPGLILAHGRPESGVNRLDVSMGIFKEPVEFDSCHRAYIIIVLCPVDYESHIEIIKDIMTIFKDEDRVRALSEAVSESEVIVMLERMLMEDN
jgi:transcriptional antiterminator/mannitol/fructose-specific phosphotransferase system IIA component (Ntr-type)